MGVIYIVMQPSADAELVSWLDESGVSVKADESFRAPTVSDIREVLNSLEGFSVDYHDDGEESYCEATISSTDDPEGGAWTTIQFSTECDPDVPQHFSFSKGWEDLIVEIVSRLATRCGTFVIIPATGYTPLVVSPGDDPKALYEGWEDLDDEDE